MAPRLTLRPTALRARRRKGVERGLDVAGLERALRRQLEGEVRFDYGSRALYATDASNYRQVPIGVVIPRTVEDVVETVRICREHGAPILSRGGGTSLAGQCCNVAVVIDWTKHLNRVLEIDPIRKTARVQPGTVLDKLRREAEAKHRLTFGPDPSTHDHCTFGGMIGNNSCGIHAQMTGPTSHNVVELEVLTYDGLRLKVGKTPEEVLNRLIDLGGRRGEIYRKLRAIRDRYAEEILARYPRILRRVSGYNLDALLPEQGFDVARALVGTEGTCVTVLEATVNLVHSPPSRALVVLGYPSVFEAADHLMEVSEHRPIGLEGMDDRLISNVAHLRAHAEGLKLLPEGNGFLLVELGGETSGEAEDRARQLIERLQRGPAAPSARLFTDPAQMSQLWEIRESGLGATARVPGKRDTWEGWEDSAVAPERLGAYLRDLRALLDAHGYRCALYGHFGQGCVHTRIDFDLASAEGIGRFRRFISDAVDLCLRHGGSLSGEHGDGQARAEFLPRMFGERLIQAFREFKAVWDPQGKMNPGKVVDAPAIDQNLRLGARFRPWEPATHFAYPDDDGHFSRATLRCVGVGLCRKEQGGTMCPSYMVTREEMHSTRGRAHLLFEMLQGQVVKGRWRDDHVKESLDLCLACKGCKGECPVTVDLATYKAEFLSHYFQGRLRPRAAYAMGLVMAWARLAALAPRLVNFVTHAPAVDRALKALAGVAQEREIPRFAPEPFQRWVRRRHSRASTHPEPVEGERRPKRVVLFPDTFNNYFVPETAAAALELLEEAGFQVEVPRAQLCCGRPLYDFGMLTTARWLLRRNLRQLSSYLEEGVPLVVLEPSCASVFRDELLALYPSDRRARQLSRQTLLLGELLEREGVPLPRLERRVLLHGHCHHKALFDRLGDEVRILERMGAELEVPDSGCCGMAGAFGYEAGTKYEVSLQCGERVLLPAVRQAPKSAILVADGFSCREQIRQTTDRQALHLAQAIRLAQRQGTGVPAPVFPERWYVTGLPRARPRYGRWATLGLLAAGTIASAVLSRQRRRST